MPYDRGKIPVSVNSCSVWVVISKDTILNSSFPEISLNLFPVFGFLSTCDNSSKRSFRTVNYRSFTCSCIPRSNVFSIDTGLNNDFIPRLRYICSRTNALKWAVYASVSIAKSIGVNVVDHKNSFHTK